MATVETEHADEGMMIDLETLGLGPRSLVVQIGIVVANLRTREILEPAHSLWLGQHGQESRLVSLDTVRWWGTQPSEVMKRVFSTPTHTPHSAYDHVSKLVKKYPNMTVWASPSSFDLAILTDLWRGKPWSYRNERDMMTLYKLLDPEGLWQPKAIPNAHDAQADAQWQMEYLFSLLDLLRNNNMIA